jgi:type I restriction enzyme, R subunit
MAERYFQDDPGTAVIKLRQFAELLSKAVAARHALYLGDRETFEDTLRRLSFEQAIPKEAVDLFHALRKAGNRAVHELEGTHADALSALKFARQLGIWFFRTYEKQPDFKPGPFLPPPKAADAAADLKDEIDALRRRIAETEEAAKRAKLEAAEHAKAHAEESEEKSVWEKLAGEAEAEKLRLKALLDQPSTVFASFSSRLLDDDALFVDTSERARLEEIQNVAAQLPKSEIAELVVSGEVAAAKLDLDEADTRALIDQQLRNSGWDADTKALRFADGARPAKGSNRAIAEWPTSKGPAITLCLLA